MRRVQQRAAHQAPRNFAVSCSLTASRDEITTRRKAMQDTPGPAGQNGGEQFGSEVRREGEEARERLRAAREAARERARQAQGWAQGRWSSLQNQVEQDPYRATAWALGIGFLAGILLTALTRGGRH